MRLDLTGKEHVLVRVILVLAFVLATITFIRDAALTGLVPSENQSNSAPVWTGNDTWQTGRNSALTVDLNNFFSDADHGVLTYLATAADKIDVFVQDNLVTITPAVDFVGERTIAILASDEFNAVRANVRIIVGTDEERALGPVAEEINKLSNISQSQELNTTVSSENISLKTEEILGVKTFSVDEKIKDENNKSVGKKLVDEHAFETFFTSIEKSESGLLVVFYHNSTSQQPVWVEGNINYSLSADTARQFENITLFVPRIEGIIPKFKLHVGISSDVFEFGKVIPDIMFDGNSTLVDRDDEKIDVLFSKGGVSADIRGAYDVPAITAKVSEAEASILKTDVFAANDMPIDNATISLPKNGRVNAVMECVEFNILTDSCEGRWVKTNIPFEQNETHITFTVAHFSAYGGGIDVSGAQHLDSNYSFISDVYELVRAKDNNWTRRINNSQFVRANFNRNVTGQRVLDIMVRGNGSIEVYPAGGSGLIVSSGPVSGPGMVYISMENLSSPADTFDLKTVGEYLEYDFIHDTTAVTCGAQLNTSTEYIMTADGETTGTCFTLSGQNMSLDCQGFAMRGDRTGAADYAVYSGTSADIGNFTMKNCFVYNFSYGAYYRFRDSYFYNNSFIGVNYAPIYFSSGTNNNISGNNFTSNSWAGTSYYAIYLGTANHYVHNNYFYNTTGNDIAMSGSTGHRIINNTIDAASRNKTTISITSSAGMTYENNTIVNQGRGSSSWALSSNAANLNIFLIGNNSVDDENLSDIYHNGKTGLIFDSVSRGRSNMFNFGNLVLYDCINVIVRNSLFENNTNYGVYFHTVDNITVINSTINNGSTTNALHAETFYNGYFENNSIGRGNTGTSMDIDNICNLTLINNTITATSTAYALAISAASATERNLLIERNYFSTSSGTCAYLSTSGTLTNATIKNNLFINTASSGLQLAGSGALNNMAVYNNTFASCGRGVTTATPLANISFNNINDCGTTSSDYGIYMNAKTNVSNNTIHNCGIGMYVGAAGGNIWQNNITNSTIWGIQVETSTGAATRTNITHDNMIDGIEPYYYYNPGQAIRVENLTLKIGRGVSSGVVTIVGAVNAVIRNNVLMSNASSSSTGLATGLGLSNLTNSHIEGNTINSTDYSIAVYTGYTLTPEIVFNGNTIANNSFVNASNDMIYFLDGGINNTIVNNTFKWMTTANKYGISTNKNGDNLMDYNSITRNKFYNLTRGIYLNDIDYITIEFNDIVNMTSYGIYIEDGATYAMISNNNITNMMTAGTSTAGIYLTGSSSKNNTFFNNYINYSGGYGIQWASTAANNSAYNNKIYGCQQAALTVTPASTAIQYAPQNIYNNTACYNKQAISFGAGFGFNLTKTNNNTFCIQNVNPVDANITFLTRFNITFNASNVFNLTHTNCTAFIDGGNNYGYNESVDDNMNTTIEMNAALSVGTHLLKINCSDIMDNRHLDNAISFEIASSNTAPDTDSVYINSTYRTNYTYENLTCYVTASDADGNTPLQIYFNWYNNSVFIPELSGNASVTASVVTAISTLGNGNTTKGQNWTCEVLANDYSDNETSWNNASLTILNTPPVITSADVTPDSPNTSSTLTCAASGFSDNDGDSASYFYSWYDTSVIVSGQASSTFDCSAVANCDINDNITCEVTSNDGESNGTRINSSEIIDNILPDIAAILLNSTYGTNYTYENLTCWINATDYENSSLIAYFGWYNNSVLYSSGSAAVTNATLTNISTIDSSITTIGENWTCEAKAWDGYNNETDWNNASLLIGNNLPNISQVIVNSSLGTNYDTEDITCWANATDVENTSLIIYFNWYTDEVLQSSGSTAVNAANLTNISTISNSLTIVGQNWTCEIKAWDGTDNETDWNNASVLILAAPVAGAAGGGGGATRVIHGGVNYSALCTESWICTPMSECIGGTKTRVCSDLNNCGSETLKPVTSIKCEVPKPIVEEVPSEIVIVVPEIRGGAEIPKSVVPSLFSSIIRAVHSGLISAKKGLIIAFAAVAGFAIAAKELIFGILAWIMQNLCFALMLGTYIMLILAAVSSIIYFLTRNYFENMNRYFGVSYILIALAGLFLMANYAACRDLLTPALLAIAGIVGVFVLDTIIAGVIRRSVDYWMKIKHRQSYESLGNKFREISRINRQLDKSLKKEFAKPAAEIRVSPPKESLVKVGLRKTIGKISKFSYLLKRRIALVQLPVPRKPEIRWPRFEPHVDYSGAKALNKEIADIGSRIDLELHKTAVRPKIEEYRPKAEEPKPVVAKKKRDVFRPLRKSIEQAREKMFEMEKSAEIGLGGIVRSGKREIVRAVGFDEKKAFGQVARTDESIAVLRKKIDSQLSDSWKGIAQIRKGLGEPRKKAVEEAKRKSRQKELEEKRAEVLKERLEAEASAKKAMEERLKKKKFDSLVAREKSMIAKLSSKSRASAKEDADFGKTISSVDRFNELLKKKINLVKKKRE